MKTFKVIGPGGTRIVKAVTEDEARHLAMVERWGDVSDNIVPRMKYDKKGNPDGYEPYKGRGLIVNDITNEKLETP